jgi:hypothetical protein
VNRVGGVGGSGIVIIRYRKKPKTNIGIGIANPTSKLHLYDDTISETKLTIQNFNNVSYTGGAVTVTNSYISYISFTSSGTLTISNGSLNCDILVIGGGGGGIDNYTHFNGYTYPGGGGGAGALIHFKNYVLTKGTYNIYVGNGGLGDGSSGTSSYIQDNNNNIFIRASGGGGGGRWGVKNADNGGSGGGAGYNSGAGSAVSTLNIPVEIYGYNGNDGYTSQGGGGGLSFMFYCSDS